MNCRYKRLRDSDSGVRKNTLMVLSHLILNDMLKAKSPVSEIAKCLEDKEERIADLVSPAKVLPCRLNLH